MAASALGDGGPATRAALVHPIAVALDGHGHLFIADMFDHRVRRVDLATVLITTVAGTGIPGFSGDGGPAAGARLETPSGLAFDELGNLFIADQRVHRVRTVGFGSGLITTVAGSGTPGFSGDGAWAPGAQLNFPFGLAGDGDGNLFIADLFNHRVRRIDLIRGIITTVAESGGRGASGDGGAAISARLDLPAGLAVDGQGTLFIADQLHRVRKVTPGTGLITTVAGTGTPGFSGDGGPATRAQLNVPLGLAVEDDGSLFIADTLNGRIRRVDLATGIITTMAGTGSPSPSENGLQATAGPLGHRSVTTQR